MSRFEILCVTMHQKDFSKIKEMNVHSDIIYANQCDYTAYEEYQFEGHVAKMISTQTRGVGINRNIALMYASADICIMADDDVRYEDDAEERILSEFERHPDADVIVFHFASDDSRRVPPKYSETKNGPALRGLRGARFELHSDVIRSVKQMFGLQRCLAAERCFLPVRTVCGLKRFEMPDLDFMCRRKRLEKFLTKLQHGLQDMTADIFLGSVHITQR